MNINSKATSTAVIDLELYCFYDQDLYEIYFQRNIEIIAPSLYLYVCGEEVRTFDINNLDNYRTTKSTVIKALLDLLSEDGVKEEAKEFYGKPINSLNKNELIDLLHESAHLHYSQAEITELYRQNFVSNYTIMNVLDYSVGGHVSVVILDKYKNTVTREGMRNLLFSVPISCHLFVSSDTYSEVYLEDSLTCRYTWDRNAVLKYAAKNIDHKEKPYILGWLTDNMPSQPDTYN